MLVEIWIPLLEISRSNLSILEFKHEDEPENEFSIPTFTTNTDNSDYEKGTNFYF
jgi:hypothetical protein